MKIQYILDSFHDKIGDLDKDPVFSEMSFESNNGSEMQKVT